jgi:DNA invertase Pin-like site-specific DNA recombinase
MKPVLIYGRISTESQDYMRQVEELKAYAEERKWEVKGIYTDIESGAVKGEDRNGFNDMLNFIEINIVDTILVWELSRIGRRTIDVLSNIQKFNEKKINVFAKKEGLNSLNPDKSVNPTTSLLLTILSGFATNERDTIKQRMQSGLIRKVSMGASGSGKIKAYGFESVDKKLVINKDEVEIVKKIFNIYLEGFGTLQISNYLNNNKIPTKYNTIFNKKIKTKAGRIKDSSQFTWKEGTVYSILTNRIYIGERKYKNEVYKIDPIIEEEIFNKVQEKLKSNFNKKDSSRKYNNYLKNLIICGYCGRNYYLHKRADNSDNVYKCLSSRYHEQCGNFNIGIDNLNNSILHILKNSYQFKHAFQDKNTSKNELQEKIDQLIKLINLSNKELENISNEEDQIIEMFKMQFISKEKLKVQMLEVQKRKKYQENFLKKQKYEIETLEFKKQKSLNFEAILEILKNEKPENLISYVTDIIEKIVVTGLKKIGELSKIFQNNQDKLLLVEVYLFDAISIKSFIISQRNGTQIDGKKTWKLVNCDFDDYDKTKWAKKEEGSLKILKNSEVDGKRIGIDIFALLDPEFVGKIDEDDEDFEDKIEEYSFDLKV